MESTGTGFSVNVAMVAFATTVLVLTAALLAAGVIAYRKSKGLRRLATVVIIGGLAIVTTVSLGAAELIPEGAALPLLVAELALLGIVFWVWMLIDCAVNEPPDGNDKLVWVLIILFTQVLGAALYLFVRRPRRLAEIGR